MLKRNSAVFQFNRVPVYKVHLANVIGCLQFSPRSPGFLKGQKYVISLYFIVREKKREKETPLHMTYFKPCI